MTPKVKPGSNARECYRHRVGHALVAALAMFATLAFGHESADFDRLEAEYARDVRPAMKRFCFDCHNAIEKEGELDLERFGSLDEVRREPETWQKVAEMLDNGEMPPSDSDQPGDAERKQFRAWVESYLDAEALAGAGDPGPVMLRRLSNAEYNYTIRDLTGVDALNPTREFPVDGAAGEGFTNAGSAQAMSPALVQKYLDAAKELASHAVLLPEGIGFSRYSTERDQTDELLARIQAFYRQFTDEGGGQAVNLQGIQFETNQGGLLPLERYLAATLHERDSLVSGVKTIEMVAAERGLNAKYLTTLWRELSAGRGESPSLLLDGLRRKWAAATPDEVPQLASMIAGRQALLWKYNSVGHVGQDGQPVAWMEPVTPDKEQLGAILGSAPTDLDESGNEDDELDKRLEAALSEFRALFPPTLCYTRIVPVDEVVTMTLYYREDEHLQRLMLDDGKVVELNRLWDELLYVAREPLKYQVAFEQIREFATQDRPDLVKAWEPLVQGVEDRAAAFRQRLLDTEPVHVQAVLDLADRAWRHGLTTAEEISLRELYQSLRDADLPHDEAIRLTITRVLTSPAFLYRRERPAEGSEPAEVTDIELASRLSYFLWSSLPDQELRAAAEAGRLTGTTDSHGELARQTRRMLQDPRTRRLAVQFACQWLHVRDFDQIEEKNERLYPEFAELRGDMYEETVQFFEDLFRNDGSILSLLDADYVFVNEALAKHYGIDNVRGDWQRVSDARTRGRGGVLGLATVLASQSGASRTSPILRGNWIYETLLGERLPRPPAGVPVLPDEPPPGLTARELIEQHSSVAACAKCHAKIDPYGFALEQYDAIGRLRAAVVDTKTALVDGTTIDGMDGLRAYLVNERRDDFVHQFCRKLLGYALGREVQLSDRPLLDRMKRELADREHRFSAAVEAVVLSDQFRKIRASNDAP